MQQVDDKPKNYKERRAEVQEKQKDMSYEEIRDYLSQKNEHILELDRLQPQEHRWIDRGHVMSCEGANHPSHRAFKRR